MNIQKMIACCALTCVIGCNSDAPDFEEAAKRLTSRVVTPRVETSRVDSDERVSHQRPHLMDAHGRYVQIKGINVSGSHKAPPTEVHIPLDVAQTGEPAGQRSRPSRYPITDRDREACAGEVRCGSKAGRPTADNHDVHGACRGGCNGMCSTGGEPVWGSEEQSTREHAGRRHEHAARGCARPVGTSSFSQAKNSAPGSNMSLELRHRKLSVRWKRLVYFV